MEVAAAAAAAMREIRPHWRGGLEKVGEAKVEVASGCRGPDSESVREEVAAVEVEVEVERVSAV